MPTETDDELSDALAESRQSLRTEMGSVPVPTKEEVAELLDTPPADVAPPEEVGDDYDPEDFVEAASPAAKPPEGKQETKPPSDTATPPDEPDAWDQEKVKAQYKTDEDRIKALAETKAHAAKLSARLKELEAQTATPAEPPIEESPAKPLSPAEERALVQQAVVDLAAEDPHIGQALHHLKTVRASIQQYDTQIAEIDTRITTAKDRVETLRRTLAYHEEKRKALPDDLVVAESIREVRDQLREARDAVVDLEDQRKPVVAQRDQDTAVYRNADRIITNMAVERVSRSREQAEHSQLISGLETQHVEAWDAVFPRVADHYKIPPEHRGLVQHYLALEAAAEIRPDEGAMIPNMEAWLMERMPRHKTQLESVRGSAFESYAETKRGDANLQPAPKGEKARAKPEEEPAPGDWRAEQLRARRLLAQNLRGVGRRA